MKRYEKKKHAKLIQSLKSPLFLRFPLFDPEQFLNRFQGLARPFFTWQAAVIWVIVVGTAIFQAGIHWPELTENITAIFTKRKLDDESLQELEDALIQADLGVDMAVRITQEVARGRYNKEIAPEEVRAVLGAEVHRLFFKIRI